MWAEYSTWLHPVHKRVGRGARGPTRNVTSWPVRVDTPGAGPDHRAATLMHAGVARDPARLPATSVPAGRWSLPVRAARPTMKIGTFDRDMWIADPGTARPDTPPPGLVLVPMTLLYDRARGHQETGELACPPAAWAGPSRSGRSERPAIMSRSIPALALGVVSLLLYSTIQSAFMRGVQDHALV